VAPTSSSLRKPGPGRRAGRRKPTRRRGWRFLSILVGLGFVGVWFTGAELARIFAPTGNTPSSRFDALIVLGTPADSDGNPLPAMQSRVDEGVKEYERGVAPRMIVTGGLDGGRFRQGVVMARVAQAKGMPASAILVEQEANDTIHNACYSARIMKAHGWRSAEVIANPGQLARAGIIFSHLPIEWRVRAAPAIEPESRFEAVYDSGLEILKTARYLLYARRTESCSP
jgi:uncharacterized SAM-binding protein YcdF (DUF218 family)